MSKNGKIGLSMFFNLKCIWVFTLLFPYFTQAQEPLSYVIGYEQGLITPEVYSIQQDEFGYYWIGCSKGLFRYDGLHFKEIKQPGRKGSIANIEITDGKRLWCQNFHGQIYTCDIYNDELSLVFDASSYSAQFPKYSALSSDQFVLATDSLLMVVSRSGKIKHQKRYNHLGHFKSLLSDVYFVESGHIFASDYHGNVACYDAQLNFVQVFQVSEGTKSNFRFFQASERSAYFTCEHQKEGVWLNDLFQITPEGFKTIFINQNLDNARILFVKLIENQLKIATTAGVFDFSPKNNAITNRYFLNSSVSSIFKDREKNTLYTTLNSGILTVDNQNIKKYNLTDKSLFATAMEIHLGGKILLGSSSGNLFEFDSHSGKFSAFEGFPISRGVRKIKVQDSLTFVSSGDFRIIEKDGSVRSLSFLSNVRDFLLIDNNIYAVAPNSFRKLNFKTGDHVVIREKGGSKLVAVGNQILVQFSDGLFHYKDGTLTQIKFKDKPVFGIHLSVEKDGFIVFSPESYALKIDLHGQISQVAHYFQADQVFSQNGKYLFLTADQIVETDSKFKTVHTWERDNRFFNFDISTAVMLNSDWFLGTSKGIIRLKKTKADNLKLAPQVRLLEVVNGNDSIDANESIEIPYWQRSLSFEISLSQLTRRSKTKLFYRIKGLEKEWHSASIDLKNIVYSRIPSGEYKLEVFAGFTEKNPVNILSIPFSVSFPFWETWWFILFAVLVFISLTLGIYRFQVSRIRRTAAIQQEMITAKLTALRAQMNPHFMFNTINSLQDLILEQDFKRTNHYLSKFARLIRSIFNSSEQDFISVQVENDLLSDYLDLEQLRFGDEFSCSIKIDPALDLNEPCIPPLLIQPYVENAILHGLLHKKGPKTLSIEFFDLPQSIRVVIEDNGIGRESAGRIQKRQGLSFATKAGAKRLELFEKYHEGQYSVEIIDLMADSKALGTRVEITLTKKMNS